MMDKDEEKPQGYINPLDLIEMMFWLPREEPQVEEHKVETMTTAEVMLHLKVSRAQLSKWSNSGELKPISRGRYDANAVRAFVPPAKRQGNNDV